MSLTLRKAECRVGFQGTTGVVYRLNSFQRFTPEGGGDPQIIKVCSPIHLIGTGSTQYAENGGFILEPPESAGAVELVILKVELTEHRPTTEGPAYGISFKDHEIPDNQEENRGAGIRINGDNRDGCGRE